ncbi:MAG: TatD family hydrolase [Acidimicrobiales bacterium]
MTAAGVVPADRPWCDSHCHLQERYLPEDGDPAAGGDAAAGGDPVADVLRRASAAGVATVVCVGTDPGTSAQALALAGAVRAGALGGDLPQVWATAGLHPHEASAGTGPVATLLEEHAGGGHLVAVGECGLDYHYDHSPRDAQRAAFAEQVALAHRHGLALVIHARQAWDDLFDVLAGEGVPERTVLHCFTGGPDEARRCLDAGMFVSFSGIVTFRNAAEVREAAALCPADRLMVETDSPFLAPVPHRGGTNEPAYVPLVGAVVAEVRGVAPEEVARSSVLAASAAFGISLQGSAGSTYPG